MRLVQQVSVARRYGELRGNENAAQSGGVLFYMWEEGLYFFLE